MGQIEYELRVLDIDIKDLKARLADVGAKKIAEYSFQRHVFETLPPVKGRWLRLRTDGKQSTLTIKQVSSDEVDGTKEWETKVGDFETTLEILKKIGLKSKGYQENKRIEYAFDGSRICIDTWPKIPPYLEIESTSKQKVYECARRLGFNKSDLTGVNTEKIYLQYGIDIRKKANLSF